MYSRESLIKAAYNFIDDYYIGLDMDDSHYLVRIVPKDVANEGLNAEVFKNEILIQETRALVAKRTGNLREMIYSRSLASTIVSGAAPEMDVHSQMDAEAILVDWFDENAQ